MTRIRMSAAVAVLVMASACAPNSSAPVRYALIYGISRYVDGRAEGFAPNLSYCDDDARAMAEILAADSVDILVRTDADASKERILGDIAALASLITEEDMLIVYFSGHGGVLSDFAIDDEAALAAGFPAESEWIFPYGAIDPDLPTSYLTPEAMHLSRGLYDAELEEALAAVPTSRKLVVLDACNSGGFISSGGADVDSIPPTYRDFDGLDRGRIFATAVSYFFSPRAAVAVGGLGPENALVLAAAGAAEFGYETTSYAHGVFTWFLLEAAVEGDLNGDGAVTAVEAFSYARAAIELTWNDDYSGTPYVFHPHLSGGPVDLVLFGAP